MNQTARLSYTIEEAVQATGMSRSRIYQAISTGALRTIKTGRRRMVSATALTEWITSLEEASNGGRKRA